MSLLFRIVYAAHANGTHHKLALDALTELQHPEGEGWRRLFLKHAEAYLAGSKAPDNEFKDFKNHVLHVGDHYWGGAPEQVARWYGEVVRQLRGSEWAEAVRSAGILSHYYTDPIHPFHTGQSEAENNIHRAVEWSISKSYDALRAAAPPAEAFAVPTGEAWLGEFVVQGAERAHRHYERLIAHYDFQRGVVDPPSGLDAVSRKLVGDLIRYASASFARVLDRAFDEAGVAPPEVALTADTLLATLKVPIKFVTKKMADAEDRRLVQAMYDELMATGKVDKTLSEDDRTVRDQHRAEVLAAKQAALSSARSRRVGALKGSAVAMVEAGRPAAPPPPAAPLPITTTVAEQSAVPLTVVPVAAKVRAEPTVTPPAAISQKPASIPSAAKAPPPAPPSPPAPPTTVAPLAKPVPHSGPPAAAPAKAAIEPAMPPPPRVSVPSIAPAATPPPSPPASRSALTASDDVERAPSIGPRMAERLLGVGIKTVGDLLAADPGVVSEGLDTRYVTARTVRDWQMQTRLVMAIPGLRSMDAQLLVGTGHEELAQVARADAEKLAAAIRTYAATPDGERIVRSAKLPDAEQISRWIARAKAPDGLKAA